MQSACTCSLALWLLHQERGTRGSLQQEQQSPPLPSLSLCCVCGQGNPEASGMSTRLEPVTSQSPGFSAHTGNRTRVASWGHGMEREGRQCHILASWLIQFSRSVMSDSLRPMDYSTPGFPVHHQFLEPTQTHVHQVSDTIQPPHLLSFPSPPTFNLSQHQGLF